jgi:tetratricopeptide (TPR) repeat protein
LAVFVVVLAAGCQHAAMRRSAAAATDHPRITADELFRTGLLQASRGDLMRAEQYLNAARSQGYAAPMVAYWLVRVCVAAGRFHSALDHASRYLRDAPNDWQLRFVVASILEALGDFDAARIELEQIVRAEPKSPLPRYRLAMLYAREGPDAELAVSHYRAYLALDPGGPHAAEVKTLLAQSHAAAPTLGAVPAPSEKKPSEVTP